MLGLSLVDDFCLLTLDDTTGSFCLHPGQAHDLGLAAAVLLELSWSGRIDVQSDCVSIVDSSPLGDSVLDPVLAQIASAKDPEPPECWIGRIGGEAARPTLDRLVKLGIAEQVPDGLYFHAPAVERSRRYPGDTLGVDEVRTRVMRTLLGGETPEARDVALIHLAEVCGVFDCMLEAPQREQARRSIEQLDSPHPLCETVARLLAAGTPAPLQDPGAHEPIPDVPGLPFLGNAIGLSGEIRPYLDKLYREHGPICRVRIPGKSIVVLSGKEGVEFAQRHAQTHMRNDIAFAPMSRAAQSGRLIIAGSGHDHIKLRRMVHDVILGQDMEANLRAMLRIAREEIARWHKMRSVSLYAAMQRLSILQVGHAAFGISVSEHVDSIRHWNDSLIISMRGDRPNFMVERRIRKSRRDVQQLFERMQSERRPLVGTQRTRYLIDAVLEAHRRQPEFITEDELVAAAIYPFFQSSDQIACTLGFALMFVLADDDLLRRCRAEADAAFSSNEIPAGGLSGLELIRAVAAETLRIHAQAPLMQRTARIGFEFKGHLVPAGQPMWVAGAVVHGDTDYYRDPEKFDPDRHLPPRLESQKPGAYMAFGVGAHACLGRRYSEDAMALNLAAMLRFAELDRFPSQDHRIRLTSYPLIRPHRTCRIQVTGHRDANEASGPSGSAS
ncbi:MAG: cytochrome P450 [Acidimicrobiaceae bacterium]|nr:cytochrome P450 [Acidimicrobiaceae bacterium]